MKLPPGIRTYQERVADIAAKMTYDQALYILIRLVEDVLATGEVGGAEQEAALLVIKREQGRRE